MKDATRFLLGIVLFFGLNCKEKSEKFVVQKNAEDHTTEDQSALKKEQESEITYLYVMAPSGLSLRKEDDSASEKLAGMPLGSQVILIDSPAATDMVVEHIEGAMLQVEFEGKTGYAFSGYLSPIRLLKKEEDVEKYIAELQKTYPDISYESKANNPDFHEGTTDTFMLPVSQWHEAYYLVAAMYDIPKSLGFPNPEGPDESVLEDPKKPAEAWGSSIVVNRKNNEIQKIEYGYRAEGFGYGVDIVRESQRSFRIEYLGFVD